MADLSNIVECREDVRVPVRGEAILHSDAGRQRARLENLSRRGVLLSLASRPLAEDPAVDVELRMLGGGGWISGRTTRIERDGSRWWVAIELTCIDEKLRARIDQTIEAALATIERRPVLVLDDRKDRRMRLVEQLEQRGFTALAPKTPLEAMDYLTRTQLHVDVCMLGGSAFALPTNELASLLAVTFPWVTTTTIDDDIEATTDRACDAWSASPVARIVAAIG